MTLHLRVPHGPAEAEALLTIHAACAAADGVHPTSPSEYRPGLDWYRAALAEPDLSDWLVAELAGAVVGYGHALWHWRERDGTQVYLHVGWVVPAGRHQGIGTALLQRLEQRCHEKAALHGHLAQLELAANASGTETAAQRLLGSQGYAIAYTNLEMELNWAHWQRPPASPLPSGYELRPLRPEHALAVWQNIGDAYDSRNADSPRFAEVPRNYGDYFEDNRATWLVAWETETGRVAAQVGTRLLTGGLAEVFEVSAGLAHRRVGLARTLLGLALAALHRRGASAVYVSTRQNNQTQAWRLYESLGFRTVKTFPRWRRAAQ